MARQPVSENAAEQQQQHLRDAAGREDQPEVRGGPGEVQNRERYGDGRQAVAEQRNRSPGYEQPEVAVVPDGVRDWHGQVIRV